MRLLRDVREGTKVLLLLELTRRRHTRLKGLAERLGLTVAGVSEYVKAMEKEGLVAHTEGEYRPTKEGVEFLEEHILALRDFVDTSLSNLAIINETAAVAGEDLKEGDRVGLFMEKGTLVARRRDSPSTGVAAFRASKGDAVLVRGLEGIVALRPGKVAIARLPTLRDATRTAPDAMRKLLKRLKPDVLAVLDVRSKVLAARVGATNVVEFAAIPGAIEAAQRGLNVLVLCPEERVGEVVAAIEAVNERSEDKIPYETLSPG